MTRGRTVLLASGSGLVGSRILQALIADDGVSGIHLLSPRPLALAHHRRRAAVVSSIGANARSSTFYLRTKGEFEAALATLGLEALVVARPSLLLGDRDALKQPPRPAEKLGTPIMKLLASALPARYRPIEDTVVASSLVKTLPSARGTVVLHPEDMPLIREAFAARLAEWGKWEDASNAAQSKTPMHAFVS